MKTKIKIIGSGFSGLATAYCYQQQGFAVTVMEKAPQVGGIVKTTESSYGKFESAAVGLVRTELTQKLFEFSQVTEASVDRFIGKKFIYRDGEARTWPLRFFESIELIPKAVKFFLQKNQLSPKPEETVSQWCLRVFTGAAGSWGLEPGLQGIYGGQSSELSATLCLKKIFEGREFPAISRKGAITMYPREGMQKFLEKLRLQLEQAGVRFVQEECSGPLAQHIGPGEKLIVATGWGSLSQLNFRETEYQSFAESLQKLNSVDLGSVAFVRKPTQKDIRGYGCLFPRGQGFHSLGIMLEPGLFRSPQADHRVDRFIYGKQDGFSLDQSDEDEMLTKAYLDLNRMYGLTSTDVYEKHVSVWRRALPFYGVELEKVLKCMPKSSETLELVGNFMGSVGLADILERSHRLAIRDREDGLK